MHHQARTLESQLNVYREITCDQAVLDDPTTAAMTSRWQKRYARDGWLAELDTTVTMHALRDAWHITARLEARDADGLVALREWDEKIARDLV